MEARNRPLIAITGCDSGIGQALCHQYLERGCVVVAGYFGPPGERISPLHCPVSLDLRSEKSIEVFAASVLSAILDGSDLHAVIQNAGMVSAAPFENVSLESVREVFEVNFFGAYSLTQKLIPSIIASRARIVLVGSLAGRIALPFFSPYVASKFAVEGMADSLRREMNPFGVKTILFEPAAVATPLWNASWERIRLQDLPLVSSRYRAVFEETGAAFVAVGNRGMSADTAAARMIEIIARKRPWDRYILSKSMFLSTLENALPAWLLDRLIAVSFGMKRLRNESLASDGEPDPPTGAGT